MPKKRKLIGRKRTSNEILKRHHVSLVVTIIQGFINLAPYAYGALESNGLLFFNDCKFLRSSMWEARNLDVFPIEKLEMVERELKEAGALWYQEN